MKLLQTRLHQAIEHAKEQVLRLREYHETAVQDAAPRTLERRVKRLPKKTEVIGQSPIFPLPYHEAENSPLLRGEDSIRGLWSDETSRVRRRADAPANVSERRSPLECL